MNFYGQCFHVIITTEMAHLVLVTFLTVLSRPYLSSDPTEPIFTTCFRARMTQRNSHIADAIAIAIALNDPFYLKFWVNRPPLEQNRRFLADNRS